MCFDESIFTGIKGIDGMSFVEGRHRGPMVVVMVVRACTIECTSFHTARFKLS